MKHLTLADLKNGLAALELTTIPAKEARAMVDLLARYRSEIADFGKPEAEPAKPHLVTSNGEGHAEQ